MGRYQISLADILLFTAVAAAAVATAATRQVFVGLAALAVLLAFVWHRPVLVRLWAATTIGVGAGAAADVLHSSLSGHVTMWVTDHLFGWGLGLFAGGLVAYHAFVCKPPDEPEK